MHVLWINEVADFTGGCERYMLDCVKLLREKYQVKSTLLYAVAGKNEIKFLQLFEAAFPMVELKRQIKEIAPDLIYIQRLDGRKPILEILESKIPVLRFFHDHKLFCLRQHKYTTRKLETCTVPIGPVCFPCLGFIGKKSAFPYLKLNSLAKMRAEQKANMKLDKIIVGSEYMRNHLLAHHFPAAKILVNHLFSSKEPDIAEEQKKDIFLFVGQIVRGKGIDILLRAWAKLALTEQLIICGSGAQEDEFKQLAEKLQISQNVIWTGRISQSALAAYYRRAICLLMPSRSPETFGLTGLEAMSYGTAIIATDVGGISTWLQDGKNGFLVPSNNVEKLASALEKLAADRDLANQFGQQGLADYQERFIPDFHIAKLYQTFYEISGRK
ncbi:MAG: glycosyltransferase family 4 protein [Candidatus Cloacimonadales bacterium]